MTKLNLSFKYSLMFQFIKKEINDNLLSPLEKCKDNDNFITNLFVELPDCEKILSVLEKVVREILDDEIVVVASKYFQRISKLPVLGQFQIKGTKLLEGLTYVMEQIARENLTAKSYHPPIDLFQETIDNKTRLCQKTIRAFLRGLLKLEDDELLSKSSLNREFFNTSGKNESFANLAIRNTVHIGYSDWPPSQGLRLL